MAALLVPPLRLLFPLLVLVLLVLLVLMLVGAVHELVDADVDEQPVVPIELGGAVGHGELSVCIGAARERRPEHGLARAIEILKSS